MDEAERCHRVALLHEGRILACDRPEALKQGVPGKLFAVTVDRQREAKSVLCALAGVHSVTAFGDRLHVATQAGVESQALTTALRQAGIEPAGVAPIAPGLEDVFTTTLQEEGASVE